MDSKCFDEQLFFLPSYGCVLPCVLSLSWHCLPLLRAQRRWIVNALTRCSRLRTAAQPALASMVSSASTATARCGRVWAATRRRFSTHVAEVVLIQQHPTWR